jgi:2-polyprenyl-6-methoxyphenol hydroxylase-like FAD-dependent oxidoreductase
VVESLGALSSLPERALRVEQIVVHINGKHAASVRVGQRTALVTRPGLVISQADVEAELRRRVTELGGQIAWGREVVAAVQDSHSVTVRLADGSQSRAGWLVGCDGASSCGRAGSRRQPAGPVRQRLLGAGEVLLRPRGVKSGQGFYDDNDQRVAELTSELYRIARQLAAE